MEDGPAVTVTVVGPDEATIAARSEALVAQAIAEGHLSERYRLLGHEFPEAGDGAQRIRARLYDYDKNQTLALESDVEGKEPLQVSASGLQPVPSFEEFFAAVEELAKDPELGPAISEGRLRPYRPMPPVTSHEERTVAVGLLGDGVVHEIVGVNMVRQSIVRFPTRAPERSRAAEAVCGPPERPPDQQPVKRGTPGQFLVTVKDGDTELWRFLAVRPAASSGTKGSGIELRDVSYRGKTVLRQAHVPILNVRYDNPICGPYRDWQWEEGWLQADGEDIAPGFRRCAAPARTILDSGEDGGNFPGVALYSEGEETVLVAEMEASWYRYVSQWRFHADGTIRPRFGFAAVANSCVCNLHHHHVYRRFDFAIRSPEHNRVREFNDLDGENWQTLRFETRRQKDAARQRRWAVENVESGEGYLITPRADDGVQDDFGAGDLWALQRRDGEIDDGVNVIGGDPETVKAHLDRFLDARAAIDDADVVVWYAAHFTHDVHDEGPVGHIVGPNLSPSKWDAP
jgi:hypothetical protein